MNICHLQKDQKRGICTPTFSHLIQNHINQYICPSPPCSITERERNRRDTETTDLFNCKTYMFMKSLVLYLPAVNYDGARSSSVAFIYFSVKKHIMTKMLVIIQMDI